MTPDMPPEQFLDIFKALANENRQTILFSIFTDKAPHSVGEVATRMGLAPSTASEHLSMLRRAGLLSATKEDKQVFYTVNKPTVEAALKVLRNWLDCC